MHESLVTEKEVGLLGNKCRFITKLYASFQNSVIISLKHILKLALYSIKIQLKKTHLLYFMEYLDGGSLEKHLEKHVMFPEYVVQFYSAEILCGLLFLHNHRIIHRFVIQ